MKKVSVLIPAYNRARYIGETLRCVLGQDYGNLEVIVLNDASTDDTVEVVKSFSDPRIKLFHNERNLGLAGVRNRLLELATGDFLAWQDSDDLCTPDRIALQVNFLESNPKVLAVGSAATLIDENGNPIKGWHRAPCFGGSKAVAVAMCFGAPLTNSSVTMKKEVRKFASFNLDFPPYEDYEFWEKVSWHGDLATLPIPLIKYRRHSSQASHETDIDRDKRLHAIIWGRRLARAGIGESILKKNMATHWQICRGDYWKYSRTINPVLEWFTEIISANRKTKMLDQRALLKDLKNRVNLLSDICPHDKTAAGVGLYACSWMVSWSWRKSIGSFLYNKAKILPFLIKHHSTIKKIRSNL